MSHQLRLQVGAHRVQARKTTEFAEVASAACRRHAAVPPSKLTQPAKRVGGNGRASDADACDPRMLAGRLVSYPGLLSSQRA